MWDAYVNDRLRFARHEKGGQGTNPTDLQRRIQLLNRFDRPSMVSARLNQEVRVKRGLSYGSYSGFGATADASILTASAQTKNETADEVAQVILNQFAGLATAPLDEATVEKRRLFLGGSTERSLETSAGFNGIVANLLLQGLDPSESGKVAQHLAAVSPDVARAVAARLVTPQQASLVIVGNAAEFLDDLKKVRPDVTVIKGPAGTESLAAQKEAELRQLSDLEKRLAETSASVHEYQRMVEELERRLAGEPDRLASANRLNLDPTIEEVEKELVSLQLRRDELIQKYTPDNRLVRDIDTRIAHFEDLLGSRIEAVAGRIETSGRQASDTLMARAEELSSSIKSHVDDAENSLTNLMLSTSETIQSSARSTQQSLLSVSSDLTTQLKQASTEVEQLVGTVGSTAANAIRGSAEDAHASLLSVSSDASVFATF